MKLLISCACGCGTLFKSSKKSHRFIKAHQIIDENNLIQKMCTKCKLTKNISDFKKNTFIHKYNGLKYIKYGYRCNNCKKETLNLRLKRTSEQRKINKKKYIKIHTGETRYHIQDKISYWRKKSLIKSDLTVDYLVNLFENQNGKCYYSGKSIFFGIGDRYALPNSASLDRLIPELGYVKNNVVWTSFFINTMKGNLSENLFYQLIKVILDYKK